MSDAAAGPSDPDRRGEARGRADGATPAAFAAERTALLEEVFRRSPSFLHVLRGPDFVFELANAAYYQLVGHRDLLGRPAFEALPEAAGGGFPERLAAVRATGVPFVGRDLPVTLARTPGAPPEERLIDLVYLPLWDAAGRVTRVLGHGTDVTDHVRERAIAEAERARLLTEVAAERERLRALIRQMPAPVALLTGPELRYDLVNAAYRRISGGRDVTGLTHRDAFPELAGQGFYELFARVYTTGEPWTGPETLARYDRDGTGVVDTWLDLRLEPVRDADGRVTGLLNFAVDVTDQVRARREVERLLAASEQARRDADLARAEAEAANRAKSEFLAMMSHELRTPLNAIGGYAQLMELGLHGPVTSEQLAALDRIQRGQQHLLGLINAVLNYAKLEAGRVEYRREDVPACDALGEVVGLITPQARQHGVALVAGPCAPDLVARADPEKVRQVLLNLLSNAVKFTDRGGTITVDGARVGRAGPAEAQVALRVRDTGCGIAADQLERVFQPFVQVDQGLTRAQAGTGLGLAISRDLARGMGGDLTAESTPGTGSTFTLTLLATA